MKSRKGFTLIELMVVVLIVAVLAAVLVPMMTARLESARWSEGKAGAGTIANSIRALYAEQGTDFTNSVNKLDYVNAEDVFGRYFDISCYTVSNVASPDVGNYPVTYLVTVRNPVVSGSLAPGVTGTVWKVTGWQLDHTGQWSKLP